MLKRIFNSKSKTVTFAAFILAVSALISRVLGLVRDRLLASNFGAGEELDIYFAAFRIPDFVYGILIVGGITAAFLPVFSEYFKGKEGFVSSNLEDEEAEQNKWNKQGLEFINNVLNCFFVLLILICGILAILTPFIVKLIIPGFSENNLALTIQLTRIMFLSPVLFGLSSIFSGVLHYFNKFFAYALAPIFYNLGIIFGILFLVPIFGIFGLIYGVVLGAFSHLLIQIPAVLHTGFKYRPVFNFKSQGIIKIFKLMLPRTVGTAAYQINLIVITGIASTLTAGSIAIFNFSNNLYYFPIGLIGVSFAVSAFPVFSKFLTNGQKKEFLENFSASIRQILFFIVPISFLIFLLRAQIVRLILGAGEFGWLETRLTAASLGVFCFGIIAGSLTPLLNRVFFALHNTKTPVIIGIISMVINVIFCFLFTYLLSFSNIFQNFFQNALKLQDIQNIEVIGLVLALSLAVFLQTVLLLIFLYKNIGDFKTKEIFFSLGKILLASVLMVIAVYFTREIVDKFVDMQTFIGVFWQAVLSSLVGASVYLLVSLFLKSPEIKIIKLSFSKQFNKK